MVFRPWGNPLWRRAYDMALLSVFRTMTPLWHGTFAGGPPDQALLDIRRGLRLPLRLVPLAKPCPCESRLRERFEEASVCVSREHTAKTGRAITPRDAAVQRARRDAWAERAELF